MLKVLMFNKLYHPYVGGVERAVYDLCDNIKDKVKLDVLAANTKFKTEIEYKDNYRVIRVASLGRVLSSVHLALPLPLWWMRLGADVIHFNFPSPVAEVYCLAFCPRRQPIVVSYHADIVGYSKALFFYAPFLKMFLKRAQRIIISSSALLERSHFLQQFKNKCTVIPYGIDIEKFRLTQERKQALILIRNKFKCPIVLFVGRLVDYKGIEYLISAMKEVNATLLLVGKGPQESKLRSLSNSLSLNSKIYFLGEVSDKDLPNYYHACDVFVLPSVNNKEEFGLVQLEAGACAKPIVSTALATGVKFANIHGITGLVVGPHAPAELAAAINKLLVDKELANQLGSRAKERVESQFDIKISAQKVLEVYREVVK
jgi:rhamnosyl/mannosyltransferase